MSPFGEYNDFSDCVSKNKDKKNPEGYCAVTHKKITDKWTREAMKAIASKIVQAIGVQYENKEDEELVDAILSEKMGNLEWIVAHWVWDMSDYDKKEALKELKELKRKREI